MRPVFCFFLLYVFCDYTLPLSADETVKAGGPIQITDGLITGAIGADSSVYVYKGIPFAAPPVGAFRWREPQPVIAWTGVRKCDHFGASAMQAKPLPNPPWTAEFMAPLEPLSEDCLYLNVWTQARPGQNIAQTSGPGNNTLPKKPVIVWIHGGAFVGGSGSVPLYDGEEMAKKGIVFVTINYRLGIFGFLAHPALSKESPHHVSGNYGILDQIAALQWVKQNIAAFGGDPENVTIEGQSAGSCSVNTLIASPLANGLFHRAIAESGAFFKPHLLLTLQQAEQEGLRTLQGKNANSLEEMRALPAEELLKGDQVRLPVVDGYLLPDQVNNIFMQGRQNKSDLLTGYNEGDDYLEHGAMPAADFIKYAQKIYGPKADIFLKFYPAHSDKEAEQSQKILSRDLVFAWQHQDWAKMQTADGKHSAYFYYFTRVPPGKPDFGAFHSAEIAYALHTLHKWNKPFTDWDRSLSHVMSSYWANFAATGDPNGKGLPVWPLFTATHTKMILFGNQVTTTDFLPSLAFAFFDSYGYPEL